MKSDLQKIAEEAFNQNERRRRKRDILTLIGTAVISAFIVVGQI